MKSLTTYDVDGEQFNVADDESASFLADFPDAKRLNLYQDGDGKRVALNDDEAKAAASDGSVSLIPVRRFRKEDGQEFDLPMEAGAMGRLNRAYLTDGAFKADRDAAKAKRDEEIATAQNQGFGVGNILADAGKEAALGAARAVKNEFGAFKSIGTGAMRLAGSLLGARSSEAGSAIIDKANDIDAAYDGFMSDELASESDYTDENGVVHRGWGASLGDSASGAAGGIMSFMLPGAQYFMTAEAANDAALNTYDEAKRAGLPEWKALMVSALGGIIAGGGTFAMCKLPIGKWLRGMGIGEKYITQAIEGMEKTGGKGLLSYVDGLVTGLRKKALVDHVRSSLESGGIMGVQSFLTALNTQAARGEELNAGEAAKEGAKAAGEGVAIGGVMGLVHAYGPTKNAVAKEEARLRKKGMSDREIAARLSEDAVNGVLGIRRDVVRAAHERAVMLAETTPEGRRLLMQDNPEGFAKLFKTVAENGTVTADIADKAGLPSGLDQSEYVRIVHDYIGDAEAADAMRKVFERGSYEANLTELLNNKAVEIQENNAKKDSSLWRACLDEASGNPLDADLLFKKRLEDRADAENRIAEARYDREVADNDASHLIQQFPDAYDWFCNNKGLKADDPAAPKAFFDFIQRDPSVITEGNFAPINAPSEESFNRQGIFGPNQTERFPSYDTWVEDNGLEGKDATVLAKAYRRAKAKFIREQKRQNADEMGDIKRQANERANVEDRLASEEVRRDEQNALDEKRSQWMADHGIVSYDEWRAQSGVDDSPFVRNMYDAAVNQAVRDYYDGLEPKVSPLTDAANLVQMELNLGEPTPKAKPIETTKAEKPTTAKPKATTPKAEPKTETEVEVKAEMPVEPKAKKVEAEPAPKATEAEPGIKTEFVKAYKTMRDGTAEERGKVDDALNALFEKAAKSGKPVSDEAIADAVDIEGVTDAQKEGLANLLRQKRDFYNEKPADETAQKPSEARPTEAKENVKDESAEAAEAEKTASTPVPDAEADYKAWLATKKNGNGRPMKDTKMARKMYEKYLAEREKANANEPDAEVAKKLEQFDKDMRERFEPTDEGPENMADVLIGLPKEDKLELAKLYKTLDDAVEKELDFKFEHSNYLPYSDKKVWDSEANKKFHKELQDIEDKASDAFYKRLDELVNKNGWKEVNGDDGWYFEKVKNDNVVSNKTSGADKRLAAAQEKARKAREKADDLNFKSLDKPGDLALEEEYRQAKDEANRLEKEAKALAKDVQKNGTSKRTLSDVARELYAAGDLVNPEEHDAKVAKLQAEMEAMRTPGTPHRPFAGKPNPEKAAKVVSEFVCKLTDKTIEKERGYILNKVNHDKKHGVAVASDGRILIATKHGFNPNGEDNPKYPNWTSIVPKEKDTPLSITVNPTELVKTCKDIIRLARATGLKTDNQYQGPKIALRFGDYIYHFSVEYMMKLAKAMEANGITELKTADAAGHPAVARNADTTIVIMPISVVNEANIGRGGNTIIVNGHNGRIISAPERTDVSFMSSPERLKFEQDSYANHRAESIERAHGMEFYKRIVEAQKKGVTDPAEIYDQLQRDMKNDKFFDSLNDENKAIFTDWMKTTDNEELAGKVADYLSRNERWFIDGKKNIAKIEKRIAAEDEIEGLILRSQEARDFLKLKKNDYSYEYLEAEEAEREWAEVLKEAEENDNYTAMMKQVNEWTDGKQGHQNPLNALRLYVDMHEDTITEKMMIEAVKELGVSEQDVGNWLGGRDRSHKFNIDVAIKAFPETKESAPKAAEQKPPADDAVAASRAILKEKFFRPVKDLYRDMRQIPHQDERLQKAYEVAIEEAKKREARQPKDEIRQSRKEEDVRRDEEMLGIPAGEVGAIVRRRDAMMLRAGSPEWQPKIDAANRLVKDYLDRQANVVGGIDALKNMGVDVNYVQDSNPFAYAEYDRRTGEVTVYGDARPEDVMHDVGWHVLYDRLGKSAEAGDATAKAAFEKLRQYANEAPQEVKDAVLKNYPDLSPDALVDELGARRWQNEQTALLMQAVNRNRTWYGRFARAAKDVVTQAAKAAGLDVNSVDFRTAEKMDAKEFADYVASQIVNGKRMEGNGVSLDAEKRYSFKSSTKSLGLKIIEDKKGNFSIAHPINGKPISVMNRVTGEQLLKIPSVQNEFYGLKGVDPKLVEAKKQIADIYAKIINYGVEHSGGNVGALDAIWKWAGSSIFHAVKANGESQYKLSVDLTTICKKTMQLLDVVSQFQAKQERGAIPSEIIRLYLETGKAGFQTPCPVCYVFSHWFRSGMLLQTANEAQEHFRKILKTGDEIKRMSPAERKKYTDKMAKILERETANSKANKKRVKKAKDDLDALYDIFDGLSKRIGIEYKKKEMGRAYDQAAIDAATKKIKQLAPLMAKAYQVVSRSDYAGWLKSSVVHEVTKNKQKTMEVYDDFKFIDGEDKKMLFDFLRADELVKKYPSMARFRTSKGSAGGKAIETDADNPFGEVLSGLAKKSKTVQPYNPDKSEYDDFYNPFMAYENFTNGVRDDATGEWKIKPVSVRIAESAGDKKKLAAIEKERKDIKDDMQDAFDRAKLFASRQNLRGMQRLWSWSDNLIKFGPDMFQNFQQLQAIGSGAQSYSKQLEGARYVASMNGYNNGSLMGYMDGYRNRVTLRGRDLDMFEWTDKKGFKRESNIVVYPDAEGNLTAWYKADDGMRAIDGAKVHDDMVLNFSDIQGIDHRELFKLNKKLSKSGNILVGMNDKHIAIALEDDRIFFVIPWHASSLKKEWLHNMMGLLGERPDGDSTDYTKVQNDGRLGDFAREDNEAVDEAAEAGKASDERIVNDLWMETKKKAKKIRAAEDISVENKGRSEGQDKYFETRRKIMLGEATDADMEYAAKDEFLSQVVRNLREQAKNIPDSIREKYVTKYGTLILEKADTKSIYPYEYWNTKSTYKKASVNNLRYLEYCRRLGFVPKFCGFQKNGTHVDYGDFHKNKGYWKTLVDRRMYDVFGQYQGIEPVDATKARLDMMTPEGVKKAFGGKDVVTREGGTSEAHKEAERIAQETIDMEKDLGISFETNPDKSLDSVLNEYDRVSEKVKNIIEENKKAVDVVDNNARQSRKPYDETTEDGRKFNEKYANGRAVGHDQDTPQVVLQEARRNGNYLGRVEEARKRFSTKAFGDGEHEKKGMETYSVVRDGDSVYKFRRMPYGLKAERENVRRHNELFGDHTPYTEEGLSEQDGKPSLVIKQPYIDMVKGSGDEARRQLLEDLKARFGQAEMRGNEIQTPEWSIDDLKDANIAIDRKTGKYAVVDALIHRIDEIDPKLRWNVGERQRIDGDKRYSLILGEEGARRFEESDKIIHGLGIAKEVLAGREWKNLSRDEKLKIKAERRTIDDWRTKLLEETEDVARDSQIILNQYREDLAKIKDAEERMSRKPENTIDNPDIRFSRKDTQTNGGPAADWTTEAENATDRFRRRIQDSRIALKRDLDERLGVTDKEKSVYYSLDRVYGKNRDQADRLQKNTIEPLVKGLVDAGVPLNRTFDLNGKVGLDDYLYAMQAKDANRFRSTGMSDTKANDIISAANALPAAQRQALFDAAQSVWKMNDEALDRRLASGRTDAKTVADLRAKYPHYVPLRTNMEADAQDVFNSGTAGWRKHEFMRALGRSTEADSPFLFSVLQANDAITGSNKNEARKKLFELVNAHPEIGQIRKMDKLTKKWSYTHGREEWVADEHYNERDRDDVVMVKHNGNLYAIELYNEAGKRIARAVTGKGMSGWNEHLEWIPRLTRTMAALRTQFVPTFIGRNLVTDHLEAAMNAVGDRGAGGAAKFVGQMEKTFFGRDIHRAITTYFRDGKFDTSTQDGQYFKEYAENGGFIGGGNRMGYMDEATALADFARDYQRGKVNPKAWLNQAKNIISTLNEHVETGTRASVYATCRRNGMSVADAISYCRDLTTNFNRKGELTPITNSLFMFSNAAIQGLSRAGAAMNTNLSPHAKQAIAALAVLGSAQALWTHFMNSDEDRKRAGLPTGEYTTEFQKTSSAEFGYDGKTLHARIRYPWAIPMYAARKLTEVALGDADVTELPSDLAQGLVVNTLQDPFGHGGTAAQTVTPSLLVPVVQMVEGKDYKGDDLYAKKFDESKPDSSNGRLSTGTPYKAVAKGLNAATGGNEFRKGAVDIAPETVKTIAETIAGGVGTDIVRLVTAIEKGVETLKTGENTFTPRDVPFASDFFRENPQVDGKYYETRTKVHDDKYEFRNLKGRDKAEFIRTHRHAGGALDRLEDNIDRCAHIERGEAKVGGKWQPSASISEKMRKTYGQQKRKLMAEYIRRYESGK